MKPASGTTIRVSGNSRPCAFSALVSSRRGWQSSTRSRTPSGPNSVNNGTATAPAFMAPNSAA